MLNRVQKNVPITGLGSGVFPRLTLALMLLGLLFWLSPAMMRAAAESSVYVEAIDWAYVRYGPGLDYPRIGLINKGTKYLVLRRDPQVTWLEIKYPDFVGGRGWVYRAAVVASGSLDNITATSETTFGYPTLTATPLRVGTSLPAWTVTPVSVLKSRMESLGNAIYNFLLSKQFEPGTQKVGSAFLMDLVTGESYSINPGLAYSGMSLIKIPILVSFYRKVAATPTPEQARLIGLMIVCSENSSSNQLLRFLGSGNVYQGVSYVTETMQTLGLKDTFLTAPLSEGNPSTGPTATPAALNSMQTTVDQVSTNPDRFNQTTPSDLGWLLAAVYQCAVDGAGPLTTVFADEFDTQKCRGIIRTLSADDIPAMLRAGVPKGIQVAHKHGWVDEVHGDAGIILTPGSDYVLVVMLRNKTWLTYQDSFPTIAEISRLVYNAFNPAAPLTETHTAPVPMCSLGSIDPQLFGDLQAGKLPPPR